MSSKPLISIIIPVYNEAKNISLLYGQIHAVFEQLQVYSVEIIFIDDGSKDDSLQELAQLAQKDKRVIIVELVRNFGKEIAITAGLRQAKGDAAIMIDGDLQHPAVMIPQFIKRWEEGSEVVVGVRAPTKNHTSFMHRQMSLWFYRIMNIIAHTVITPNATDFRLVDRLVIDEFNRFTERNRLTRGLIDWLGFRHAYVTFKPNERVHGSTAYSYGKLIGLAVNSIVSMSHVPLKVAGYLGFFITLVAGLLGLFIFFEKYVFGDPWNLNFSGPAILAVILLFLVGIILICLGLIALYIANIYGEVVNRPLYVERRKRKKR